MKKHTISIPRRIYHWINLLCMIALTVSGWYVHKPFSPGLMGEARFVHLFFAYVFGINIILRVYYSFGKNGDWRKYLKPTINKETLHFIYRHYLLYDHLPEGEHYRLLQNASYLGVVLLFFLQIITGVLLFEIEGPTTEKIVYLLGGASQVRQIHLFLLWIFAAFTVVHIYMAITEDLPKVKEIFLGGAQIEKHGGVINEK